MQCNSASGQLDLIVLSELQVKKSACTYVIERGEYCFTLSFFHVYTSNLRDAPTEIGEIVVDICRLGASFISWS